MSSVVSPQVPSRAEHDGHPVAYATTTYIPGHPISLRQTVGTLGRGPADPTTVSDETGFWRASRTPHGTVTLHLRVRGASVEAEAWGDGAAWMIERVPQLLGRDDDWSGVDVARHPLVRDSAHRNPGLRLIRSGLVLESLIPTIIEQRVTSLEAYRGWSSLVRRFGEVAPGPAPARLRVMPTPVQWRRIPSWVWHRAGVDPRRSKAVISAAQVADGLERTTAPGLHRTEVEKRLRSVPGIGGWTAAETMARTHGDPDAVSVGDYHLAHWIGEALIGTRVDDDGMLELLEPWTGHRQRVIRLILASGVRFQRHGPRMPVSGYENI